MKIDSKPVAVNETLQWALNQADDDEMRLLLCLQFPYWLLLFLQDLSSLPNKMPLNSEGLQLYLLDSMYFFFHAIITAGFWVSCGNATRINMCVLNKKLDTFKNKTFLKRCLSDFEISVQESWHTVIFICAHRKSNYELKGNCEQLWLNKERISRQRCERESWGERTKGREGGTRGKYGSGLWKRSCRNTLSWCLDIKSQLPQGQVLAWHFWRTGGLALRWYLLLFIQSSPINADGVILTHQLQSRPSLFFPVKKLLS